MWAFSIWCFQTLFRCHRYSSGVVFCGCKWDRRAFIQAQNWLTEWRRIDSEGTPVIFVSLQFDGKHKISFESRARGISHTKWPKSWLCIRKTFKIGNIINMLDLYSSAFVLSIITVIHLKNNVYNKLSKFSWFTHYNYIFNQSLT